MFTQADETEHLFDASIDRPQSACRFFVQLVADISRTVSESNSAPSWKSSQVGSTPPSSVFRQLVNALAIHPDDARFGVQQTGNDLQGCRLTGTTGPRMILVCPLSSVKLTSRSTTLSSNASCTCRRTDHRAPISDRIC
jgi:hypothetical protein